MISTLIELLQALGLIALILFVLVLVLAIAQTLFEMVSGRKHHGKE